VSELHGVLLDLGDPPQPETVVVALLRKYDSNGDGLLDLLEFSDLMVDAVIQRFDDATEGAEKTQTRTARRASQTAMQQAALNEVEGQGEAGGAKQNSVGAKGEAGQGGAQGQEDGEEEEAEEEAEEVPDDLKHLTWAQQQRRCDATFLDVVFGEMVDGCRANTAGVDGWLSIFLSWVMLMAGSSCVACG
jgi:hypothetical protein